MILTCLTTLIINMTAVPFNDADFKVFSRAQNVCSTGKYGGCLAKFMKKEKQGYRIYCGDKVNFSKKQFDKDELDMILYELRHLSVEDTKKALKKIDKEL